MCPNPLGTGPFRLVLSGSARTITVLDPVPHVYAVNIRLIPCLFPCLLVRSLSWTGILADHEANVL